MRTWQVEAVVVVVVLAVVVLATGGAAREWIGALGVLGSFLHAQVGDRLAEREAEREAEAHGETAPGSVLGSGPNPAPTAAPGTASGAAVSCYRWAGRYFVLREIAWFAYFASGRCWSALVGCGVFLVYPLWRRWWRLRRTTTRNTGRPSRETQRTSGDVAVAASTTAPPDIAANG